MTLVNLPGQVSNAIGIGRPASRTETPDAEGTDAGDHPRVVSFPCPCCGDRLMIVAALGPGGLSQQQPTPEAIDRS